ncbi:hypothetical protein ACVWW6_008915 [Bradyrhizobium sp. USDA 3311]
MAAVTAPERTAAQHQSLLHFVGSGAWSDEKVLGKVREMVLPAIERQGPIEAWIIADTGFPSRGDIQLELHGNIAGSSASRIIVRWRYHCRLPTTTPACLSLIPFIFRRNALRTAIGGARWAFLPKLASGPSRRSRWSSCGGPVRAAFRAVLC